MIDPRKHLFIRHRSVEHSGVPVFFIHMITRYDRGVSFSQFDGKRRVAFKINAQVTIEVYESEDFSSDFEYQSIFTKGKAFGSPFF